MKLAHFNAVLLLAATAGAALSAAVSAAPGNSPRSGPTGLAATGLAVASPAPAGGSLSQLTAERLSPLATALNEAMNAYAAGDYRRARSGFRSLADQGSAIAETMLGVIYARGQGVRADPATAAGYWLRAASRGYPAAQLAFARALVSGAGVARDPGSAWVWASLAARGGDVAVAHVASGLAAQLQRGFTAAQAAILAKRLAGWRPWMAG